MRNNPSFLLGICLSGNEPDPVAGGIQPDKWPACRQSVSRGKILPGSSLKPRCQENPCSPSQHHPLLGAVMGAGKGSPLGAGTALIPGDSPAPQHCPVRFCPCWKSQQEFGALWRGFLHIPWQLVQLGSRACFWGNLVPVIQWQ